MALGQLILDIPQIVDRQTAPARCPQRRLRICLQTLNCLKVTEQLTVKYMGAVVVILSHALCGVAKGEFSGCVIEKFCSAHPSQEENITKNWLQLLLYYSLFWMLHKVENVFFSPSWAQHTLKTHWRFIEFCFWSKWTHWQNLFFKSSSLLCSSWAIISQCSAAQTAAKHISAVLNRIVWFEKDACESVRLRIYTPYPPTAPILYENRRVSAFQKATPRLFADLGLFLGTKV